jgi:hypothetical protein
MAGSFTQYYPDQARHLEIEIMLTNPILNKTYRCKALWDTGANRSMISTHAALELELNILGIASIEGFHGEDFRPFHDVNIGIVKGVGFEKIRVVAAKSLAGRHALLGMDIISQLDFAITNVDGATVHSIRFPSAETIDFETSPHS